MSIKIASCRHALQNKFVNNSTKPRASHTFTKVMDFVDDFGLRSGEERTLRKLTRLVRMLGGSCDWPERRIAAHLKLPRGTYRDHRRVLERVRLIVIDRRRQFGCRMNDTNILRLGDGGLKPPPQSSTEVLTTTTPRKVPRGECQRKEPSKEQLQWERRRRNNHPPAMQKLYEWNALLWAKLRCKPVLERDKSANQGVYRGECAVVTPERAREISERVFAREREGIERFRRMTGSWRHG